MMITLEELVPLEKTAIPEVSKSLEKGDIVQLVEWLEEKDDKIRYNSLLLLQSRSTTSPDVYPFWDIFKDKLKSENSYQRSIGLMLMADNTKWDVENKLDLAINDYLMLIDDEKPITVRQCIQALLKIIPYKKQLCPVMAEKLTAFDISKVRETMQKPVLLDILNVLIEIRKYHKSDDVESYILKALSGGIIDGKTKRMFEKLL